MKKLIACFVLTGLCFAAKFPADFPGTEISNNIVKVKLYLPDAVNGYYQGTRFDWAGVIPSLTYKNHSYFGQWFPVYDPKLHDAISGPVEEFTVIGFEEAEAGNEFLKIGVGALVKPDDKKYSFARTYEVKKPGKWEIKKLGKEGVEFTHTLTDAAGYSYIYKKTVRLTKGKPELVLEHSLKNTGQKTIETSIYDHNFFMIDNVPTGPDVQVRFPFDVKGEGKGFGTIINAKDKKLVYTTDLPKGENVFSSGLQGFGNTAADYDIRIENVKSGGGVRITGDTPLEKLVFWACNTTSCPEPYIHLKADPGKEIKWKLAYEFYEIPGK